MFSELFNELEEERRQSYTSSFKECEIAAVPRPDLTVNQHDFFSDEESGEEFLRRAVFYKHARNPIAVGFKIFFHQARSSSNARQVWKYLICDKDIRIIHLTRANLIESWLSLNLAFKTNQWVVDPANVNPQPPEPLHLLPNDCEGYLRESLVAQRWARIEFRHHRVLEFEYEADLCQRFDETMQRLHYFLEVPRLPAKKRLRKQAQRKPSEQISNYQELKTYFAPTPFARWFE
jgi:hypothetical protein